MVSMDWIRRNWPDLLIGLALLLVIGGIIATLLNGGNFLPFGRSATPTPVSTPADSTEPIGPVNGGSSATTDGTGTAPSGTDAAGTSTAGGVAPVDLSDNSNAATSDTVAMPESQGGEGTIIPVAPSGEVTPDTATEAINEAAGDTSAEAPTESDAATSDVPTTTDVAASSSPAAPYRISVGAFGSSENAERRAQAFRDAGYPVFVADQGDLALVLVGPYDSQGEAEQVKAQLQSSGLEANPIIYEFSQNDIATSSANSATSANTSSTTTTDTATTTSPETSAAPATSSSGQYLQVGAYGSLEAAAPQRSRLEDLGFSVSSVEEGSYIKLVIGPYDEAGLTTAQSQLAAQGIDSFVR
jgi:cell division septation protein DedD